MSYILYVGSSMQFLWQKKNHFKTSNDGPNGPNMNKRRARRPCHGVHGRRGLSTCSTRPLFRINKRVPTCQYLQSFVIWSGREIHRSSKSHRWGAVFCTSFRGANERMAALSSFYRNGWRGPVNGHHAVSQRMVTYAKKEFDKQS